MHREGLKCSKEVLKWLMEVLKSLKDVLKYLKEILKCFGFLDPPNRQYAIHTIGNMSLGPWARAWPMSWASQ